MPKEESCFIERLYTAIQEQRSSVVDWDPSGKGFIVGNLTQFTNQVLLRKFGIGRLDSFARKLNKHGFKRSKIDRNKIRFFHKYFNRDSKNLSKIKKLTKQESLPKHIKLKLIREELSKKNSLSSSKDLSDVINQIFENEKVKESQHSNEPLSQSLGIKEEPSEDFKSIEQKQYNKKYQTQSLKEHETLEKTCNSFGEKSPEKPKGEREEDKSEDFNLFLRQFYFNNNNLF